MLVAVFALVASGCQSSKRRAPPPTYAPPPAQSPPPQASPFPWGTPPPIPPLLTPQGWGVPLPTPIPPGQNTWSQTEWDVVQAVNGHRARGAFCGGDFFGPTNPLMANPALHNAARNHSWDMGRRNYFDHMSPEGHGPNERTRAAGYPSGAAENIHAGSDAAHAAVNAWMTSPGHCRNFMNPNYREIGVGHAFVNGSRYGHYWTANIGFGR